MKTNPNPKLKFEEYSLDPKSASTILYTAFSQGDVQGKRVIDLGSGTGILSIGAAILGARCVVGIDIDKDLIRTAIDNMNNSNVRVEFVCGSIDCIRGLFETTIMNPPFGSWRRGLDAKFLDRALIISSVIYSVHKASDKSDMFLRKKVAAKGGEIGKLGNVEITLPRLFDFHRKAKYKVNANFYRTIRKDS
nr:METTL5 family protein [Candidatus Njordarchaeum guaymaensis]